MTRLRTMNRRRRSAPRRDQLRRVRLAMYVAAVRRALLDDSAARLEADAAAIEGGVGPYGRDGPKLAAVMRRMALQTRFDAAGIGLLG